MKNVSLAQILDIQPIKPITMQSKKVTRAEMEAKGAAPIGILRGGGHPIRSLIMKLLPGEILFINKGDWTWKHASPNVIVKKMAKRLHWQLEFSKALDNSGWFVERIK